MNNVKCLISSNIGESVISARQHAYRAICYRTSVRLSLSVTRVYHRNTLEVRIKKFSPYGSPIPLVFADSFIQKF